MSLLEILDQNKAEMSITLQPSGEYTDYYAHIKFAEGKIRVQISDDEGGSYGSDDEPMRYEWIEQITKLVNELKEAKMIPDYTLTLLV